MNKNKLTFWGVRGSNPTPDRDKVEYGGHTSCVSCHTDNNELLVVGKLAQPVKLKQDSPLSVVVRFDV